MAKKVVAKPKAAAKSSPKKKVTGNLPKTHLSSQDVLRYLLHEIKLQNRDWVERDTLVRDLLPGVDPDTAAAIVLDVVSPLLTDGLITLFEPLQTARSSSARRRLLESKAPVQYGVSPFGHNLERCRHHIEPMICQGEVLVALRRVVGKEKKPIRATHLAAEMMYSSFNPGYWLCEKILRELAGLGRVHMIDNDPEAARFTPIEVPDGS